MWDKINNQKVLDDFKRSLDNDILEYDLNDAKILYTSLRDILVKENINETGGAMAEEYYKLMRQAGFVSLALLEFDDAKQLFAEGLPTMLELSEFDVLNELKKFFIYRFPILADRLLAKNDLQKIIEENNKRIANAAGAAIGEKQLFIVSDWIKNYLAYINQAEPEILKLQEYLARSEAMQKTSEEEKNKIGLLLKIYDYLRMAQFKPFLLDEELTIVEDGETYTVTEGRAEKVDPNIKKLMADIREILEKARAPEEVATAYSAVGWQRISKPQILKKYKTLEAAADNLFKKIAGNLLGSADKDEALSILYYLAEENKLMTFLKSPANFSGLKALFAKSKKLTDAQKNANIPELTIFLQAFLRYIFEELLEMSVNEAAREGQRLANALKKSGGADYFDISYFDLNKGQFVWK
ncbi:MAG: hypothetical protein PHD51_02555 [Patescibacteria group bacterium]|nr:hypothetical protein [Patescibacteria group bacterium]MDD5490261.1 hypothetical protein [Patescibacteria group bacterium]